ncbi:MAG: four helix bundle suffix domain-containing protein, partial [Tidjanibacter sp.]|nr:four helix bundle suffix domain-containing protein [Tidjanibacter sp.]
IILIYQADYLLFRLLERLKADFLQNGGVREQMTQARLSAREKGH